jgi:hypothetical protein
MSSDESEIGSEKTLRVDQSITSTATATVWQPPIAGEKVVLKGCALRARVTTTLAGVTPGEGIYLLDQALANPILCLAVFKTATDAVGTDYGMVYGEFPGGYRLSNNPLTLRLSGGAITGGAIQVIGRVWGDESL